MALPMPLAAPVTSATRPAIERLSVDSRGTAADDTSGVLFALGLGEFAVAVVVTSFFAIPLAVTLWAFLDAARRPQWAWALAGRNQVLWIAVILFAALSVVGGLCVSAWYLSKVRPVIAAAEQGRI